MGLASGLATTTGVLGVALNLSVAPIITSEYNLISTSFITLCLTILGFTLVNIVCYIDRKLDHQIRENTGIKTATKSAIKATNFFKEI